jgi:hypothetical protein
MLVPILHALRRQDQLLASAAARTGGRTRSARRKWPRTPVGSNRNQNVFLCEFPHTRIAPCVPNCRGAPSKVLIIPAHRETLFCEVH